MKYILVVGYVLICICSLLSCNYLVKKSSKVSHLIRSNYHKIIIIEFGIGSLIWMLCFANNKSLWYDDLFQISFSGNNQSAYEVFNNIVNIDLQPPLFAFIAMIWLRIAPYGTGWIKLISELAVFVGIILIGLTASKTFNKRVGIISTFLLGTSYVAILDGAYSFRPYGYVIFFTILLIHAYVNKNKKPCLKNYIYLGLSMILLVCTHYLGVFSCFTLFIFDFIKYIRRKSKFISSLPYFMVAFVFLPWVALSFQRVSGQISTFWPPNPNITSIKAVFEYLTGYQEILFLFFIIGVYYLLFKLWKERISFFDKNEMLFVCVFAVCILFSTLFIYSTIINPKGSVWVKRYFICVFPFFILFLSNVIDIVIVKISSIWDSKVNFMIYGIIICTLFTHSGLESMNRIYKNVNKIYEPFEEAAQILKRQDDIYNSDVIVYSSTNVGAGWNYYLTENGKLQQMNWADNSIISSINLLDYNTIYVFDVHDECKIPKDISLMLKENYDKSIIKKEYKLFKYTKKVMKGNI